MIIYILVCMYFLSATFVVVHEQGRSLRVDRVGNVQGTRGSKGPN